MNFQKYKLIFKNFQSIYHISLFQCIKESYVKALGVGIHMKLDTIQCCVQDDLFDDTSNF